MSWMEDLRLKQELEKYVRQGLKRDEILNFMERDFDEYAWSLRTLDRRMRHFDIRYTDTDVTVEEVTSAVRKEIDGPGKLLGYRAMHNKIRQEYLLNVQRNLVHAVMFDLDPEGLETRCPTGKKRTTKGHFSTKGGCTRWMAMTSLWVTRTVRFLKLFTALLTQPVEKFFGLRFGLETRILKGSRAGI